MRQWWALLPGLLPALLVGCITSEPARTTSWLKGLKTFQGPVGGDVVIMDVALVEQPIGDHYINQELWGIADEQVIAIERKPQLEDNGLRIGQMGGIPPAGLQALLLSERSCANPRRIQLRAGHPTTLKLGPTLTQCQFQVHEDGRQRNVALEQAQCTLQVTPTLTPNGRTRLQFTPQVQYGEKSRLPKAVVDPAGVSTWVIQEEQPAETFSQLSWEVTLEPNEYVIIGARYDRPDTLGSQCFICKEPPAPAQRLLVIRTSRMRNDVATSNSEAEDAPAIPRSPPLACQACFSAINSNSP